MKKRLLLVLLCIVLAAVSVFVLSPWLQSPDTHKKTIESLDKKQKEVMILSAGAATAATIIAAIPGDATTPIGQEIANLASYFMVALCAVLLEKYMLTILCYAAWRYIIPAAMILMALYFLLGNYTLKRLATKLIVFGLCLTAVIPISVKVSDMIEDSYKAEAGNPVADILKEEEVSRQVETEAAVTPETEATEEEKGIWDFFADLKDNARDKLDTAADTLGSFSMEEAKEQAKTMLNQFLEATAVFLLSSCVVPVLVLVVFAWLIKIILEVDISNMWDKGMGFRKHEKKTVT